MCSASSLTLDSETLSDLAAQSHLKNTSAHPNAKSCLQKMVNKLVVAFYQLLPIALFQLD